MGTSTKLDVAIVGGGPWGRALATAAARAGASTTLVTRRGDDPPAGVQVAPDLPIAARSRLVVLAVPSDHVRDIARTLGAHLDGSHLVVHGIRGLVPVDGAGRLDTISDVLREETPARRIGALGGPVLASELVSGSPSLMVVGSRFREVLDAARDAFASSSVRVYTTRDLPGLEWASALTGALGIAIGYALGSRIGPGLVAAFTTRAVHEAARIATAAGGQNVTLLGLAGLGDLLAAVGQEGRPEVVLGRRLAEGSSVDDARKAAGQRIEALELLPRLQAWTEEHHVRAPITAAIVSGIFRGEAREEMIRRLMSAPLGPDEA